MRYILISIVVLVLVVCGVFGRVQAYSLSQPQSRDLTNGVNNVVNGVLKGFAPGGAKNTAIPEAPASNSSGFSTNDLITPFKAIITLVINLFFVVIQVVIDILKALLSTVSNYKP